MSNITKRNGSIVVKGHNGKIKDNISLKGKNAPTAAKPILGKTVQMNDNGRYTFVREKQDKPSYIRTGKNTYANAVLGTQKHIYKDFLNATEEQAVKVFKADANDVAQYANGEVKFNRAADVVDSIYSVQFSNTLQEKINSLHPNFFHYYNDNAWEVLSSYAYYVSLALRSRGKISQNTYDILTRTWRKYIGSIHPDDENLLVKSVC